MALNPTQISMLEGAYKARLNASQAAEVAGCSLPTAHKHYMVFKRLGIERIDISQLAHWANDILDTRRAA